MAQYIQKKFQQTPLNIGMVEDSLESGSPVNAPSIRALLEALYHPNLLINGDFQCNQRGQSEYTAFSTGAYNLDMWRNYFGNSTSKSVKQVENGVEIFGNVVIDIEQYVDYKNAVGKLFAIGCSVDNIRHEFTFTMQSTTTSLKVKENITVSIRATNERITLELWNNTGAKILVNYIDLFEGNIVYPHVRKDYATALMRCQQYVISLQGKFASGNVFRGVFYTHIALPVTMKATPTVTISGAVIIDGLEVKSIQRAEGIVLIPNGISCIVRLGGEFSSSNDGKSAHFEATTKALITCEPL